MNITKLLSAAVAAFVMAIAVAMVAYEIHRLQAEKKSAPPANELPAALVVYCFHGNQQRPTCKKIEDYTREVLETSFAAELKAGQLVWRVVNYELPENAHFVKECQITTTCIVLADWRPGRSEGLCKGFQPKTWDMVDKKKAFMDFMRSEIQDSLYQRD